MAVSAAVAHENKNGPRSCEAGRRNCTCRAVPAPPEPWVQGVGSGVASGSSACDDHSRQDSFPTNAQDRPKDVWARRNATGDLHTTLLAADVKAVRMYTNAGKAHGATRSFEVAAPPRYNRGLMSAMKCFQKVAQIRGSRARSGVHADSGAHHPLPFSMLIAPAYDASVTAYKFPQFETHSLSR